MTEQKVHEYACGCIYIYEEVNGDRKIVGNKHCKDCSSGKNDTAKSRSFF